MTEPATDTMTTPAGQGRAPVVLRIVLAIVLLIPGVAGVVALGILTGIWMDGGFDFTGSDRGWMPLFIIPSVACILFSVLTVGVVLRFARWKKAPTASLVLSVTSAIAIVIGHQLMLDSLSPDDTETPLILLVVSAVALALVSAPPFLHWWNARAPG